MTLKIEGMHCASCFAIVEKGLNKLNGVDACRVNLAIHSATVEHNNDITSEKIISEIEELGYKATIGRPDILAANEKEAKKAKDFERSDALSDEIMAFGVSIMDTAQGTFWERTE